ncbi:toll-interacting protein-like [Schistocerca nitens]|uniref:toll-interacting protein-like n=1 Tax=Schistocerca nitens TaxID=7011 RepID=UPI0021198015|nr:toll-interacting protein-like [Schistocerca nitens]
MSAESAVERNAERRKRVFVGALPPDFLRISTDTRQQQQESADQQAALALHHQMVGMTYAQNTTGRLSITIGQAKLVKNYGMTRMDPYVRLRVGHCVYETHTDPNGGKNPRWNKVIQCLLPQGVTSIYLEIYDECSFTMDELIAWAHIPIPQAVMNGETHEEWYQLSGKQGEGMEGMINLVLSYTTHVAPQYVYSSVAPVVMVPSVNPPVYGMRPYAPVPVYTAPPTQPPQTHLSEQELKQIEEMFPNMDKEVIKSVFEANRGSKDGTVNSLLQMSE